MAYGLKKISPLDLKPSTAIGIKVPFSSNNAFSSVYTTKDQIRFNLINFLLTNPGERIFNPSFGAGLRAKIFEQIDQTSFEEMKNSISSQLENNFPQIQVTNLSITGDLESQIVNVNFSYKINRSNENDSVVVTIQTA